jgi:hypothetical protein
LIGKCQQKDGSLIESFFNINDPHSHTKILKFYYSESKNYFINQINIFLISKKTLFIKISNFSN